VFSARLLLQAGRVTFIIMALLDKYRLKQRGGAIWLLER
jgi:hypothetical protein